MIRTVTGAWLDVAEASVVVKRSKSTIYRWIAAGTVRTHRGPNGTSLVWGNDLLATEARTHRGRPSGTARPRGNR